MLCVSYNIDNNYLLQCGGGARRRLSGPVGHAVLHGRAAISKEARVF